MNSSQLAIRILLAALASCAGSLALAEAPQQPSVARTRAPNPQDAHGVLSAVRDPKPQRARSEDWPPPTLIQAGAVGELAESPVYSQLPDNDLGRCFPPCQPAEIPCSCFYGQVDALFLTRESRFRDQPIIVDPNTGTTFLSTSDLDSDFDPGVRVTAGMRLCDNWGLEFSYFGLFDSDASASVVSPGPGSFLTFPDNLAGNVFVDIDRVRADYSSRLHSFEVNLPCCTGCCTDCCTVSCGDAVGECGCGMACSSGCGFGNCQSCSWFAGFRYLNLREELNLGVQRDIGGGIEDGSYNVRTRNRLYGVQVGGRVRRTRGRIGWEGVGKTGIFGNDSEQQQSVTDFPNFPLRPTTSNSSGGVAFVNEASLTALYRLTHIWTARVGYTALWIEGLALAPDQLDFDFANAQGGNQLNNGRGLLLHGVTVGLEARW